MEMFHKTRFRDGRISSSGIHNYVPSRVCVGGASGLLWSTFDRVQVSTLGLHGRSFQRVSSDWRAGGAFRNWYLSGG
ncbi:hypothetical protein LINPERPRIM_LOCUS4336 [Linum perenne]